MKALENKHQGELEDLLKKLYEQRARELRDQIIALLEEKVQGRGVIDKEYQAKKDAQDALEEIEDTMEGTAAEEAAAEVVTELYEDLLALEEELTALLTELAEECA